MHCWNGHRKCCVPHLKRTGLWEGVKNQSADLALTNKFSNASLVFINKHKLGSNTHGGVIVYSRDWTSHPKYTVFSSVFLPFWYHYQVTFYILLWSAPLRAITSTSLASRALRSNCSFLFSNCRSCVHLGLAS